MVDIFDEIEEDLRAERAEKLLKKYGWLIGALAVAIVLAAAGWQFWGHLQAQKDAAAATQFIAVQNALQSESGATAAQRAALDKLATSGPEGYKTLARISAATAAAKAGHLPQAEKLWNAVAADSSADPVLRDFASLLATGYALDSGDPSQLRARIEPLADPGNPWSSLAREQLAILSLREGQLEKARQELKELSTDLNAPAGVRARAVAALTGLRSETKQ